MNQSQVQNFLSCLSKIDDFNYLALHYNNHHHSQKSTDQQEEDDDHDHDHFDENDHDHSHSDGVDLITAKATAMVVLFIASTLCGSIPFLLNRFFKWNKNSPSARSSLIIKSLLYFGGGVLICTTFLHLLPEVQESVEHLQECGTIPELTFPLAEFLMCSGFLIMYLIEELIHFIIHRNKAALKENETEVDVFERRQSSRRNLNLNLQQIHNNINNNNNNNNNNINNMETIKESLPEAPLPEQNYSSYTISEKLESKDKSPIHQSCLHQHLGHSYSKPNDGTAISKKSDSDPEKSLMSASLRGFFIVLALSLHELFEGMAIGLEGSASAVWFMFGAVSAHKLVLAFCVGIELIVAKTKTSLSIIYILTFAVVSPLGIGIGILISRNDNASAHNYVGVILQGLACGTLLYVVIFEILSKNDGGVVAYLALLVGFVVMFGLQQLASSGGHGHSHGAGCTAHDEEEIMLHNSLHHTSGGVHDAQVEHFEKKLQQLRHASEALLESQGK